MALELQTIQNNTAQLSPLLIRNGMQGNIQVLFEMIRLTNKSLKRDLAFNALAADLLLYNGLDSTSEVNKIFEILFNFVAHVNTVIIGYDANKRPLYNTRENPNQKKYVSYIQDVAGDVENIKDARRTLSDGFGDCDDHAILNASLLGALGFEDVRFAIAKYSADGSFQHVYCIVYHNGKRVVFDTTLPDAKLNTEVKATEVKEISVFGGGDIDKLSFGLFNAKHQANKIGKAITEAIPTMTAFLPLGFISGNALSASAQLLSASDTRTLSFPAIASKINERLDNIIVNLIRESMPYDLAKSYALQVSVQVNTVEDIKVNTKQYNRIKQSIKERLDFIAKFPAFASAHNIKLIYLNARMIFLGFLSIAGFAGFTMYKYYQR